MRTGCLRRTTHAIGIGRLLPIVLAIAPLPLSAQGVRGIAVQAESAWPIQGAFVSLLTESGDAIASTLTGPGGAFAISLYRAGRYRLRVYRIGYETWTSVPFDLSLGQTLSRRLEIPIQPIHLTELHVSVESFCRPRPGAGEQLARVWEETRKALEMTRWTATREPVQFDIRTWFRELDPRSGRIRGERSFRKTREDQWSFLSAPVEALAAEGYVREEGGGWQFFAPDADVLLSDPFGERHCFSLRDGEGEHEGLLGLAFEPMERPEQADIEGVLWLNRATGGLSHLEYDYTGLGRTIRRYRAGGRVDFLRLPTGHWVVRRWWVRMPIPEQGRVPWPRERRLAGYTEAGGEVVRVVFPDGEAIEPAEWGSIIGTVYDSLGNAPLAGGVVLVRGADYEGRTDSEGRLRLDFVAPGEYTVRVEHPDAGLFRLAPLEQLVEVRAGRVARIDLAFPALETTLARVCPDPEEGRGQAHRRSSSIVVGYVRDAESGEPVPGARVWIGYSDHSARLGKVLTTVTKTWTWTQTGVEADATGAYSVCGLPGGRTVIAQAETGGAASDAVWRRTPPGGALRLDFEVSADRSGRRVFGLDAPSRRPPRPTPEDESPRIAEAFVKAGDRSRGACDERGPRQRPQLSPATFSLGSTSPSARFLRNP
jgi:hypothetical protein